MRSKAVTAIPDGNPQVVDVAAAERPARADSLNPARYPVAVFQVEIQLDTPAQPADAVPRPEPAVGVEADKMRSS
ncbi:hypothetical protein OGATHE_003899 [Ogataea polymorpha]|uniref:Uncharacterized protein n=1 Tax=Ogataea polymorpha TaxID=460523 RepID=A0A9P8P5I8_9ASCO|nr:hypothetical protein OGATHE_003899 [Ogataea polymorpha]